MTKSFDLEKLKQKTKDFTKTWQVKLNYLSESVSRSGIEGATHWLKSHHQIDELKSALNDLLVASEQEDFRLSQVETTLSSFNLPEEDFGQAEWYITADNWLTSFQKKLVSEKIFDVNLLQNALKEMKFISQAKDFHQRYGIEQLQDEVAKVYQTLFQEITDFKIIEKEKNNLQQQQDKVKLAELDNQKAQAEAKKALLESVKIKEKRLAIMEEKKRRIAEKESIEAQAKVDVQNAELLAKQADVERQSKLQDAYLDLQIEEKVASWSLVETIKVLRNKLNENELDSQLKLQIMDVLEKLDSLEA